MSTKALEHKISSDASFRGDVDTRASVRVNRKGGSFSAILKKILIDRLGWEAKPLEAATVDLGSGRSLLLMGAVEVVERIQVKRNARGRVEIAVDDEEDTEVDSVTETLLRLKTRQLERGDLSLSNPLSAEDWAARSKKLFHEARERHATTKG